MYLSVYIAKTVVVLSDEALGCMQGRVLIRHYFLRIFRLDYIHIVWVSSFNLDGELLK